MSIEINVACQLNNILIERFAIDPSQLSEASRLKELGLDSMLLVDILLDLEAALNTRLADLPLPPDPSLGELAAAISKNLAPAA